MDRFLLWGTILGAICGVLHAPFVYRNQRVDGDATPLKAAYFAAWALGLWTLFGAYLLFFWLIGLVGLMASQLARRPEPRA